MDEPTPNQLSEVLGQVQQAYESKHEKLKELRYIQQLLLHTQNLKWKTEGIPRQYHDMRRTADLVYDDSGDNLFVRKIDSDPCIIYNYQVSTNQWQLGAKCPSSRFRFSMAYHKCLMMIGGAMSRGDKATRTGEVQSFVDGSWRSRYPDMPTSRSRSTALTCHVNQTVLLIVIGGEDDSDTSLNTVEILNMTDSRSGWQTAHHTPEPLCSSSGVVVTSEYVYVLGGWSKRNNPSSAAFRCSINSLIESTRQPNAPNVWERLPELPVEEATCTSFHNTLIVAGGRANTVAVHDIRTYNPDSKRWEVIGYLPNARYICFAIGLPDKLIVLGGKKDTTTKENTIDILLKAVQ